MNPTPSSISLRERARLIGAKEKKSTNICSILRALAMGSASEASKSGTTVPRRRVPVAAPDEQGYVAECSGGSCRSCTAILLADCIALCCCPCAVINLLTLAFLKVPWVMGRRCLRLLRKKKRLHDKRSRDKSGENKGCGDVAVERVAKGSEGREVAEGEVGITGNGVGGEDGNGSLDARLEAERLWLDWYQVGHWGFGRVSFSGVQGKDV